MKIALSTLAAASLLLNVGCANTKTASHTTDKPREAGSTYASAEQVNPDLTPIASAPPAQPWGGNRRPYSF